MFPESEGRVWVGVAIDVEVLGGVAEDAIVAVGRSVEHHHLVAFMETLPRSSVSVVGVVTNAVVHERTPVRVSVDWHGSRLHVEATDRSDKPSRPRPMPHSLAGGGRGLALVAAIAAR